jgi:hypothetical protein
VTTLEYNDIDDFSEGLARVMSKNRLESVCRTGKLRIAETYEEASNFGRVLAKVEIKGSWGIIGANRKKVAPPHYDDADDCREGLGRVKSGYNDKVGKIVIKPAFESADTFRDGLALVETDRKKGYFETSGWFVWEQEKD